jgi:hypothetical protein
MRVEKIVIGQGPLQISKFRKHSADHTGLILERKLDHLIQTMKDHRPSGRQDRNQTATCRTVLAYVPFCASALVNSDCLTAMHESCHSIFRRHPLCGYAVLRNLHNHCGSRKTYLNY